MRMIGGVLFAAAALAAATPAAAFHQPGDIEAKVFEATIDANGTFNATANDSSGGSWTISAAPSWKVVFPALAIPMMEDGTFNPNADYNRSGMTAGTVTWAGTTQYDFETPAPDPFTCTAPLAGPRAVQGSFQYPDRVIAAGEDVRLELTTLNQLGLFGNGTCSPPQSTGFAGWSANARNFMQVFTTIPREELFENNSISRPVGPSSANSPVTCTVFTGGGCTGGMEWGGSLELRKVCRNHAGTATNAGSGFTAVTNPFCESPCADASCSQEDLAVPPLAEPAKERKGKVPFVVSCYGDSPCSGSLKLLKAASGASALRAGGKKLGSASFQIQPAAHALSKVKLTKAALKRLKKKDELSATLNSAITGDVADATDSLAVQIKD
jgi:hypothetical protein